jgi:hypothetical protein
MPPACSSVLTLLVLLVNDSEYSDFTSQKPIQCHGCIYFVCPLRAAAAAPGALESAILGRKAGSLRVSRASPFGLLLLPFFGKKTNKKMDKFRA